MTPQNEAHTTSSSMEEVAAKRPEEVRSPVMKTEPREAHSAKPVATPPQSSLRDDSSSIEEERGAWLKRRAKKMRTEMTPHESAMWSLLHEGDLVALNWRKQAPFGGYILDFVSHPARLVVEVDGSQHAAASNAKHDAKRTAALKQEGYRVLRFWNDEVLREREGVWRTIYVAAEQTPAAKRMQRWREKHMAEVRRLNAQMVSSTEVGAGHDYAEGGSQEAPALTVNTAPHEVHRKQERVSPPQSSLRADSSSIEEEQS